jgi:hypothetical protein
MRITTVTGRLFQPASQPKNLFKLILELEAGSVRLLDPWYMGSGM